MDEPTPDNRAVQLERARDRIEVLEAELRDTRAERDALTLEVNRNLALLRGAAEGILVADLEQRRFRYANPTICQMLGYTTRELYTLGVGDIHPAEDLPEVIQSFEAQSRGDLVVARNLPCKRKDGSVLYADITTTRVLYDGVDCNLGFFLDVSDRIDAEEALLQSERKAQNILDASPMGVFIYRLDAEERLIFSGSNSAAASILGVDTQQFMGLSIEEAFPPLARTEVPARYLAAARDGRAWHTEQIDYQDDRLTGAFEVHAFQTKPGEMAALFFDITDRKRAAHELAQYRDRLEVRVEERTEALRTTQRQLVAAERLAVLGKFAGSIAHEIRNPLTVIANATFFLQRRLETNDDKTASALKRIERQIERTTEIIESILKLTRPSPTVKQSVDVTRIIRETAENASLPAELERHWALADEPLSVEADPQQLSIALDNLLRNAVQAMPQGGRLTIGSRRATHDDVNGVEIFIGDTGPGISEQDLDAVFEPLFTTKTFGVGFGLSIVRLILERHGGTVRVTSAANDGATFTIWLPE